MSFFRFEVAVSLVDDSFLFTTREQKEPLVVPAYVAIAPEMNRVLSVGADAKKMMGRAPGNIHVFKVLENGRSIDIELASALMRHSIQKLRPGLFVPRPVVVIALRFNSAAKGLAKNTAIAAGAKEVHLLDVTMATAIGMKLETQEPDLNAVLTISEDWFEFAVISLSGIVAQTGGDIGWETFVEDIQNHLSLTRQFRPEADAIGLQLMAAGIDGSGMADIPGWEVWTGRSEIGRTRREAIAQEDFTIGVTPSLCRILERIKSVFRQLTPEQQSQLIRKGIHATGSAMQIPGLPEAFARQLGCEVFAPRSRFHPSINGAKRALEEVKFLRAVSAGGRDRHSPTGKSMK